MSTEGERDGRSGQGEQPRLVDKALLPIEEKSNPGGSPGAKKPAGTKDIPPLKSIEEFLERFLERKGKILTQDKKVFDRLPRDLSEESRARLVHLFLKADKDLKYCLNLADFLLEGSIESANRLCVLHFIENVLSDYSLFSRVKSNSVLQRWLDESSGRSDKLGFFDSQFRSLSIESEDGARKGFSDAEIRTLLCISAVWLYFKKQSDFFTLTRYLSQSAFDATGKSQVSLESQAFAFATSMITSSKKRGFSFFLKMVSEKERALTRELAEKNEYCDSRSRKINQLEARLSSLQEEISALMSEKDALSCEVTRLEKDVSAHQVKARHRDTHHRDSKDGLRIKIRNVLSGELSDVLKKASKAHAKEKHDVVEYQIHDALEILAREIEGLGKND